LSDATPEIERHLSPGRIGLIGDVHGNLRNAKRAIRMLAAEGITEMHFLGDFGFVWTGAHGEERDLNTLDRELAAHDARALVTGGNHDGYDLWGKVPVESTGSRHVRARIELLPRGWRATSPSGNVLASLGGANSVDMPGRLRSGEPHWPAEQITESDLVALGDEHVDVLLGHDAPRSALLRARLKLNEHLWEAAGLAYADRGQVMFHRGVSQVRPRLTVSGHYHLHLDVVETFEGSSGTPFECRTVILNADGQPHSLAILHTDSLQIEYLLH
jgi:hypothetical protein